MRTDTQSSLCHFCLVALPPDAFAICSNCKRQIMDMPIKERMSTLNGFWQVIEQRRQTTSLSAAAQMHRILGQDLLDLIELCRREAPEDESEDWRG